MGGGAKVKNTDLHKHLTSEDITVDESKIKWNDSLKNRFLNGEKLDSFNSSLVRTIAYRPFNKEYLYYYKQLIHRPAKTDSIFPSVESENLVIATTGVAANVLFSSLLLDNMPEASALATNKAFPLYRYESLLGGEMERVSNIRDEALNLFREKYKNDSILAEDIFYYIYAALSHRGFIERYKDTLKKVAPRVPLASTLEDFEALVKYGRALGKLHLGYEDSEMMEAMASEYGININDLYELQGDANEASDDYYKVTKMSLTKDGSALIYNENIRFLLKDKDILEYKVNGSSALWWLQNRYEKKVAKNSVFIKDPNSYAGGRYIFNLACNLMVVSKISVLLQNKIAKIDIMKDYK